MSVSTKEQLALEPEEAAEIEEWIYSYLASKSELDSDRAEELKEPLKALLHQLVDRQHFEKPEPPPPEPVTPEKLSLVDQVGRKLGRSCNPFNSNLSSPKKATRSFSKPGAAERKSDTFIPTTTHEKAHFSEFGARIAGYGFSKAERNLDLSCNRSPGPAFYTPKVSALQERPAIYIPVDEKVHRDDFLQPDKETPCPSYYYPSKHALSTSRLELN